VKQVLQFAPAEIALCDSNEERLFHVDNEVRALRAGLACKPFLMDVRDSGMVAAMFRDFRPDVVFHAAAYKHVPLVELNPCEAILNNVQGLQTVSLAALDHGVKEFVFISTDKAVRPVNIMGATKRLGENIIQALNRQKKTRFMAVRFGNVLGSSGSVVPIFQAQIRKGGPVSVTHPDMTRYFMLISEAVELVIQAGSIGRGGEIFILDMGKPVRILDMAHDLIRLMGKEPERDIKVEFTGIRPGERLYEELLLSPKDAQTSFPDIWIDHEPPTEVEWETLGKEVEGMFRAARLGNCRDAILSLKKLVPEFVPGYVSTRASIGEKEAVIPGEPQPSSTLPKARVPLG
jgi:FlaA1/EpsC-like NDP-sugar epimerase